MSETALNAPTKATARFEAGRLLWSPVRDYLATEKLKGRAIAWHEGSGWFSRMFTIHGDAGDVQAVYAALRRWAESLDEEG